MAKNPESPLEPFKRALAHAARSLAETPDLEIVYSGEGPQLSGNRAVLPHPPRDLTPAAAPAMPVNPSAPAISATTAKIRAHLSILNSPPSPAARGLGA